MAKISKIGSSKGSVPSFEEATDGEVMTTPQKPSKKEAAPTLEDSNENLSVPPRKSIKNHQFCFNMPQEMADRFNEEAYRRYGFIKGAKSKLFVDIWKEHEDRQDK